MPANPATSQRAQEEIPPTESTVTCEEWLSGSATFRAGVPFEAAYGEGYAIRAMADGVLALAQDGEMHAQLSDGTDLVGAEAVFDWACPSMDGSTTLASVRDRLVSDSTFIVCSDYLQLPDDARLVDFQLGWDFTSRVVVNQAGVARICEANGAMMLVDAFTNYDQLLADSSKVKMTGSFAVNGYTYTVDIDSATVTQTYDVLNAAPGQVNVDWVFSVAGTLTNTTPERNAPVPVLYAGPMWLTPSKACLWGNDTFTEVGVDTDYCDSAFVVVLPTDAITQLAPGQSVSISYAGCSDGHCWDHPISEEARGAFEVASTAPYGWWVLADGVDSDQATDPPRCYVTTSAGMVNSSARVVATSPQTGCA